MANREPFSPDRWYHCYNRGIDKRRIFESDTDYKRFVRALYLCNSTANVVLRDLGHISDEKIFQHKRSEQIVSIASYCLMPNHFHLLLKEKVPGGISKFMRKLGVAYTMYFNVKNKRTGNLLTKPFRSKPVDNDSYFKHVVQYIHMNPAELIDPLWKTGKSVNIKVIKNGLEGYRYSSAMDFFGNARPESSVLDKEIHSLYDELPSFESILADAASYYRSVSGGIKYQ